MDLRAVAFAALSVFALSCGSKSTSSTNPPPAAPAITLGSTQYTLQPGDEKYFCYTMTLPADTVVNGFVPAYGQGTHHILFAQTLAPEPDGFSECNVLIRNTWVPMFVGGKGTGPLTFPTGAGMHLLKGQQILLQLHLQNTTGAAITDSTSVAMQTVDPSVTVTPAGIFGIDNRKVNIAPYATGAQATMTCPAGKTMNVFAVFGHMHKHGTHIKLTRNGTDIVYDADWKFDAQPTGITSLVVAPTDNLELQCTYDNPGATPVVYGESSDNEMCSFVLYYTTFDGLAGCVQQ